MERVRSFTPCMKVPVALTASHAMCSASAWSFVGLRLWSLLTERNKAMKSARVLGRRGCFRAILVVIAHVRANGRGGTRSKAAANPATSPAHSMSTPSGSARAAADASGPLAPRPALLPRPSRARTGLEASPSPWVGPPWMPRANPLRAGGAIAPEHAVIFLRGGATGSGSHYRTDLHTVSE